MLLTRSTVQRPSALGAHRSIDGEAREARHLRHDGVVDGRDARLQQEKPADPSADRSALAGSVRSGPHAQERWASL